MMRLIPLSAPNSHRSPANLLALAIFTSGLLNSASHASVNSSGSVSPTDPSSWSATTDGYIGYTGSGQIEVNNGSTIATRSVTFGLKKNFSATATIDGLGSYWKNTNTMIIGNYGIGSLSVTNGASVDSGETELGYVKDSLGTLTIDGTGSTFTCSSDFNLGNRGSGLLYVTNGGRLQVTNDLRTGLANYANPSPLLIFGPHGGTVTTKNILISPIQISGTGTINTLGIFSDLNLTLNSTSDLKNQIIWQNNQQNVTINYDLSSNNGTAPVGVGYATSGSLTIGSGFTFNSLCGYLGYLPGSSGTALVDGPNTTWNCSTDLNVGINGHGSLTISHGATVTSAITSISAFMFGSTGAPSIDLLDNPNTSGDVWLTDSGSSLTSSKYLLVGTKGHGTIHLSNQASIFANQSIIGNGGYGSLDVDGTGTNFFTRDLYAGNSGHGTVNITNGGNITLSQSGYGAVMGYSYNSHGSLNVDGPGSSLQAPEGSVQVGFYGYGYLNVTRGGTVFCDYGYIAAQAMGVTSLAVIDGPGSLWSCNYDLYVGYTGLGTLKILNGGTVNSSNGYVGFSRINTQGTVLLDGSNSTWNLSGDLYVGFTGQGTINITNGATLNAANLSLSNTSLFFDVPSRVTLMVGDGSSLNISTGTITNNGIVRLTASPKLAGGFSSSPISALIWDGTGSTQPIGGTWDDTYHTFTASTLQNGHCNSPITIDRSQIQRIHITTPTAPINYTIPGDLIIALTPTTNSPLFTLLVSTPSDSQLSQLLSLLPSTDSILSTWNLSSSDYTPGDPLQLSFDVGPNFNLDTLSLWHLNGSTWSLYSPNDFSYDGTYANFTTTTLGLFALSSPPAVPEPASFLLLASGTLTLLARRRNSFNPHQK